MTQPRAPGSSPPTTEAPIRWRIWSVQREATQVRVSTPVAHVDPHTLRIALSQPATDDPIARTWARALILHTAEQGLPEPDAAEAWLTPAWQRWRTALAQTPAPASPGRSLDLPVLGAAALCALELTPRPGGFRLTALFQGDVSLFQVRGRSTVLRLPLRQAVQFGNGASFFSEPIPSRTPPRQIQQDVRTGDTLVLASPALARWIYARLEEGRDPWPTLLRLPDDDAFGDLVRQERSRGRLEAEDAVLLVVRTDPPPPPLPEEDELSAEEPLPVPAGVLDPHDLVEPRQPLHSAPPQIEEVFDISDELLELDPVQIDPDDEPTIAVAPMFPDAPHEEPLAMGAIDDLHDDELDDDDPLAATVAMSAVAPRLSLQAHQTSHTPDLRGLRDIVLPDAVRESRPSTAQLDGQIWDESYDDDEDDVELSDASELDSAIFGAATSVAVTESATEEEPPPPAPHRSPPPPPAVTSQDALRMAAVAGAAFAIVVLLVAVMPYLQRDTVPAQQEPAAVAAAVPAPTPAPEPAETPPTPVAATAPPTEARVPEPSATQTALLSALAALQDQLLRTDARLGTAAERLEALAAQPPPPAPEPAPAPAADPQAEARVKALEDSLAQQEARLREQTTTIAQQEAKLKEQTATIAQQEAKLREQTTAQGQRDREARAQAATIAQQEAKIRELEASVRRLEEAARRAATPATVRTPEPARAVTGTTATTSTASASGAGGGELAGVRAQAGQSTGWVRCVAPLCARTGQQAVLQGAAPAWASPYSESRTAFVGAGSYAVLDTTTVAGESWVEIRFR